LPRRIDAQDATRPTNIDRAQGTRAIVTVWLPDAAATVSCGAGAGSDDEDWLLSPEPFLAKRGIMLRHPFGRIEIGTSKYEAARQEVTRRIRA
jgi:hypothetical protein